MKALRRMVPLLAIMCLALTSGRTSAQTAWVCTVYITFSVPDEYCCFYSFECPNTPVPFAPSLDPVARQLRHFSLEELPSAKE